MRVAFAELPPELEAWLERRRALGQDRFDEVWDGVHHVAALRDPLHGDVADGALGLLSGRARARGWTGSTGSPLGQADDYRVPDGCYLSRRPARDSLYLDSAEGVAEVVSAHDETWETLPFYFSRGVEEVVLLDPATRGVHWFGRGETGFEPRPGSALLDYSAEQLRADTDCPDPDAGEA